MSTDEWIVDGKKARLYKGRPLRDCPKSYKKVKIVLHNHGSAYNPNNLTIYKAKDGTLRYEIYRDGCFYPYYGKLEFEGVGWWNT